MWTSIVAIASGAALGATLRWLLGVQLNELFPLLPLGTLTANLLGAYLIGLAIAVFVQMPDLPVYWKLFVVTGFLGALTTFSSFSAEMVVLLQEGKLSWAVLGIAAHVLGSLTMTFLGLLTIVALDTVRGV